MGGERSTGPARRTAEELRRDDECAVNRQILFLMNSVATRLNNRETCFCNTCATFEAVLDSDARPAKFNGQLPARLYGPMLAAYCNIDPSEAL